MSKSHFQAWVCRVTINCSLLIGPLSAVLVREIDDLLDAALDDHLGALVAREEGDVDRAPLDVRRVLVQYGVHLGVAHVQVLVLQLVR